MESPSPKRTTQGRRRKGAKGNDFLASLQLRAFLSRHSPATADG
jgi:hypothetical protein